VLVNRCRVWIEARTQGGVQRPSEALDDHTHPCWSGVSLLARDVPKSLGGAMWHQSEVVAATRRRGEGIPVSDSGVWTLKDLHRKSGPSVCGKFMYAPSLMVIGRRRTCDSTA
jgi:hypothetical protein